MTKDHILGALLGAFCASLLILILSSIMTTTAQMTCREITGAEKCVSKWVPVEAGAEE